MIIVLVGLPCSGKPYLGKEISKEFNIPYLEDIQSIFQIIVLYATRI